MLSLQCFYGTLSNVSMLFLELYHLSLVNIFLQIHWGRRNANGNYFLHGLSFTKICACNSLDRDSVYPLVLLVADPQICDVWEICFKWLMLCLIQWISVYNQTITIKNLETTITTISYKNINVSESPESEVLSFQHIKLQQWMNIMRKSYN